MQFDIFTSFLTIMFSAAVAALFFMSYMTSEEDSFAAWFKVAILRQGTLMDEKALKKKRDAKMDRLLNERVRVKQGKDEKASEATGTEASGKARARREVKKDR